MGRASVALLGERKGFVKQEDGWVFKDLGMGKTMAEGEVEVEQTAGLEGVAAASGG